MASQKLLPGHFMQSQKKTFLALVATWCVTGLFGPMQAGCSAPTGMFSEFQISNNYKHSAENNTRHKANRQNATSLSLTLFGLEQITTQKYFTTAKLLEVAGYCFVNKLP